MEECSEGLITSLPDELITLILINNEPQDIISFSSTCKQFYESVTKNEYLWKVKYTEILPGKIAKIIKKNCSDGMLQEVKNIYKLKQTIYKELQLMSPKFYSQVNAVSYEHIRNFFVFATESNISYYYTIYILQDVVAEGYKKLNNLGYDPLYNLTVIHYAKKVLYYLFHTFLSLKWVREFKRNNLTPQIVINYFLQWVNCEQFYTDEDVDEKIQVLVRRVKNILNDVHPNRQGENNKKYTEREVLQALTQAIYMQNNFSITQDVQLTSFDICKVIEEGNGIGVVYGAIYQSVAKCFGVTCTLITFSNHLFLEWRDTQQQNKKVYIDLHTGQLKPRNCPYSNNGNYVYTALSLVQYLLVFMIETGNFLKCQTQYALQLSGFLYSENQNEHNPYRNFFRYLNGNNFQNIGAEGINMPLDMEYLHGSQLQTILTLSNLNEAPECVKNPIVPKKHPPKVLYPVGMVCYHEVHHYLCIILGWELDGSKINQPIEGSQPFYLVLANDQSERYIAQGHLKPVTTPFRLIKFEPEIARNFTHFDGYTYVLNQEKKMEYPNEEEVIEVYKSQLLRAAVNDVLV